MKSFFGLLFVMLPATLWASITFDDVDFWAGEGSNRAAMVIDWNDGETELVKVWGFRWDGTATAADMIMAVCQADSSLYAMGTVDINEGTAFGGFGYDADGDDLFNISKGSYTGNFGANGFMSIGSDSHFDGWNVTDAGDVWESGWFIDGYWAYYSFQNGNWTYPGAGASARVLTDGSWDGWSWSSSSSGWDGGVPSIAVVPEPATLALLGVGLFLVRRKK